MVIARKLPFMLIEWVRPILCKSSIGKLYNNLILLKFGSPWKNVAEVTFESGELKEIFSNWGLKL